MRKRRVYSIILAASVLLSSLTAGTPLQMADGTGTAQASAQNNTQNSSPSRISDDNAVEPLPQETVGSQPTEEELAKDDPGYFRLSGQASQETSDTAKESSGIIVLEPSSHAGKTGVSATSPYTGTTYNHADAFDGMNVYNGVDVSYYQKTIDWNKAKADGIDYAIIRMGYRGYSSGALATDTMFAANMQGAIAAGIKVGVYFFSLAVNADEAMAEAQYVANAIAPYQITMPVAIDWEYLGNKENDPRYTSGTSKATNTMVCTVFCDIISTYGYTPMVYANKNDLTNHLDGATLGTKYEIWLARYNNTAEYNNPYSFWQYSSKGSVNGMSGSIDMNFWYTIGTIDNPVFTHGSTAAAVTASPTPEPTEEPDEVNDVNNFTADYYSKSILLSWNEVKGASGYEISRKDTYNGSFKKIKTINDGEETSWENTKLSKKHEYYYKIRAFIKLTDKTIYSDYTNLTAATMPARQVGITRKTTKLTTKPGKKAVLLTLRSGFPLEAAGITHMKNGKKYLHVRYYTKTRTYDGYLPTNTSLRYYTQKNTTATLNMRRTAGTNGKLLTSIPKGTPLPLMGKKKVTGTTWYKIVYCHKKGKLLTGYVSGDYLT